ncbi:YqiA/YcfP family alpha/beta fold hydrolase [Polynucleobacter sp. 30F-ANTBAC]|uniref:YqiA/YcfP family alpha/beta fold hydrolase n=1 Tax=Polynucleobacter sp. 30F-ANTBAC TaxID=2689095 RepID=UPI00210274DD|nr:YqiA/YcfP family alpha/beta fold hydrolase [Polynucleobacter sp. 30F-ANTBAC]
MHLIIYLHGFKSSPESSKAVLTKKTILSLKQQGQDVDWYCPQLPPSPQEAMAMVCAKIDQSHFEQLSIMGSSLGGYYATYLGERYAAQFPKVTLLNPAIEPARDLEKYIGEQKSWHSEDSFYFKPEYIEELRNLYQSRVTQLERYNLIACKGDEVLDWQEMVAKYPKAHITLQEGGDHAISNYSDYVTEILKFHGLLG